MWEHHIESEIESEGQLLESEREALVVARRGQGLFKQRVMHVENRCRSTGVTNPIHLRPSQCIGIQAMMERINGENGLLLTPTMDHLFDRGFISYEDSGIDRLIRCPSSLAEPDWSTDGPHHQRGNV
jgi:hypothetical protein